jgi:hypothetical protein
VCHWSHGEVGPEGGARGEPEEREGGGQGAGGNVATAVAGGRACVRLKETGRALPVVR